jgi:hypothetical protein
MGASVRGIENIRGLGGQQEASRLAIEGPEEAPPEAAAVLTAEVAGAQG